MIDPDMTEIVHPHETLSCFFCKRERSKVSYLGDPGYTWCSCRSCAMIHPDFEGVRTFFLNNTLNSYEILFTIGGRYIITNFLFEKSLGYILFGGAYSSISPISFVDPDIDLHKLVDKTRLYITFS